MVPGEFGIIQTGASWYIAGAKDDTNYVMGTLVSEERPAAQNDSEQIRRWQVGRQTMCRWWKAALEDAGESYESDDADEEVENKSEAVKEGSQ